LSNPNTQALLVHGKQLTLLVCPSLFLFSIY